MNRKEQMTRLVARIPVTDSSGARHTVEEHGDFFRVQYHDNSWSEWTRGSGKLLMKGQHVNPTDDDNTFEVAMTGEKLTVMPSPK